MLNETQRRAALKLGITQEVLDMIDDVEPPVPLFDYDQLQRVEKARKRRRKAAKAARRRNRH